MYLAARLIVFSSLLFSSLLYAEMISTPVVAYTGDEPLQNIKVLAAFELIEEADDGTPISGLSALAWDSKNERLYAISDRGWLHHLRLQFDDQGHLDGIDRVESHPLRDKKGEPLSGKWRDAESAFVVTGKRGESLIGIGFERSPRIVRYRTDGYQKGRYKLPKTLAKTKRFHKPNDMFEAVVLHPESGVMAIPQKPLKGREINALYQISDARQWDYSMEAERGNSMSALEVLPDGSLLAMERAWGGYFYSLVITLKHIRLEDDTIRVNKIARMSNTEGWLLDNFEGLAHFEGERFFIVSDDNQNPLQRTLLYFIEVKTQ